MTDGKNAESPPGEPATFPGGAVRSRDADAVRYDLISPIGLRRLAETYREGAEKYGPGNWLKGFPASDLINHLQRHIELWKAGDRREDHLAHATWGLFTLMHFSETRSDLMDVSFSPPLAVRPRLVSRTARPEFSATTSEDGETEITTRFELLTGETLVHTQSPADGVRNGIALHHLSEEFRVP